MAVLVIPAPTKILAVLNLAVTALLHLTRTQNNAYVMSYLRARAIFKHLMHSIAELALSRFTAARIVTMSIDQFEVSSVIRGHHVYKHNWSPFNGEELTCLREEDNDKDRYAVAVTKSGSGVVGHVPRRISAACALFLQKGGVFVAQLLELGGIIMGVTKFTHVEVRK